MLTMLLALVVIVGGGGFWYVRSLASQIDLIYGENLTATNSLSKAERALWELRFALPNFALADTEARAKILGKSDELLATVRENIEEYSRQPLSDRERRLMEQWNQHFADYVKTRPRYFELMSAGKSEEALAYRARETNPAAAAAVQALSALIEEQREVGGRRAQNAGVEADRALTIMAALVTLALVLGFLLSSGLTRHVSERIAEALRGVQHSTAELETTASQQVNSAKELATTTTEISVTVRELLATARQISEAAAEVSTIAEETGTSAKSGDSTVKRAQGALVGMKQKVDETVAHMLNLGKRSQQIGGILEVINELADQTNILSVNARIEAAGASEAGRRFAVVADEIRRLADRVASSARDIRTLVDEIRAAANTTVMVTEDSAKAVELGTRQFDEVLKTFQRIAERVNDTSRAARQIELSTKQQVGAVEQVNTAMSNVVRSAKDAEAGSQHTLKTCERLGDISRKLATLAGSAASSNATPSA